MISAKSKKIKSLLRIFTYGAVMFLPNVLKIWTYSNLLGHEIDKTARIGLSYVEAKKIKMGPKASIRNFSIIRNLELLEMGQAASIGPLNHASAMRVDNAKHFSDEQPQRFPALIMGDYSAIVKNHFFDCNNTVTIGHHSLIAGFGSAIFTHGVDLKRNRQSSAPVTIGNYCMVASHAKIIKGSVLPDYSVLAAGSTLHKAYADTHTLYSGVPAEPVKKLDPACEYFHRAEGYVP